MPEFKGDRDNVEDWVDQVRSMTEVDNTETDKVYVVLEKNDRKVRTHVYYRWFPEECTLEDS